MWRQLLSTLTFFLFLTFSCSFGAKIRSKTLGIVYNDQLWDAVNLWVNEFHLEPDTMKPRKRPMSLASPSIIVDEKGNVRMVIGAAGGKYIATALAQVHKHIYQCLKTRFSHVTWARTLKLPEISSKSAYLSGNLWDSLTIVTGQKVKPRSKTGVLKWPTGKTYVISE